MDVERTTVVVYVFLVLHRELAQNRRSLSYMDTDRWRFLSLIRWVALLSELCPEMPTVHRRMRNLDGKADDSWHLCSERHLSRMHAVSASQKLYLFRLGSWTFWGIPRLTSEPQGFTPSYQAENGRRGENRNGREMYLGLGRD
jgi:hypothetical protein